MDGSENIVFPEAEAVLEPFEETVAEPVAEIAPEPVPVAETPAVSQSAPVPVPETAQPVPVPEMAQPVPVSEMAQPVPASETVQPAPAPVPEQPYVQPQAYPQPQGYAQPQPMPTQPYVQPQAYPQPQGYVQPQPMPAQPYVQPQAYPQAQGYPMNQGYAPMPAVAPMPGYTQPAPMYGQPVYNQPVYVAQPGAEQKVTAGPMKHAGSPIVLTAGVMAALQLIIVIINAVSRVSLMSRYARIHWADVSSLVIMGPAFLAIAIELLVTWGTAKRKDKNPSKGGLVVGLIAGIIHLIISFVMFFVLLISSIVAGSVGHALSDLIDDLGLPVQMGVFVRFGYVPLFVMLLLFNILWIIMHFALNNTRINMMRRISGRRFKLNPVFAAVMLFINAVPFLFYAIAYIGMYAASFRHIPIRVMGGALMSICLYLFMPLVLILSGVALIGLKKDK